jgi:predicted TIM-barrel fold metal-dependent hydrolase
VVILCLISCQPSTNKNLPIIDMHMHSYPVDYMGGSNIPNPVTGRPSGVASDEELMLATINWIIPREEFHEYLRDLIRAGFGKRLMFGSDQMVWPEAIGMAIEGIESAKFLTKEEKRDIFYNNASRFLNLKETVD